MAHIWDIDKLIKFIKIDNMFNISSLSELLFPTRCAGCGRYEGRMICSTCASSLPLIRGPVCLRCGKPTLRPVEWCPQCRERLRGVDATAAMALYEEPLRPMIHKMKYGNGWRLSGPLGHMAAVSLAPLLQSRSPQVTFVPMHPRKRRARGYDQAELLAGAVAEALGLKKVRLLERVRRTASQASLSLEERKKNVRGAFRVNPHSLDLGEVVLVDDVMTTGYTMNECAAALKRAGASRVVCCVLARELSGEKGERRASWGLQGYR